MYDVFLSFDGKYRTLAEKIKNELESKYKLNVFIDNKLTAKDDRFQAIKKAIDNSLYMLVLYSKEYETNEFCIKEFTYSEKIKKLIFIIDDTKKLDQDILNRNNNKKENYLIKGRLTDIGIKGVSLLSTKYIVNDNVIFDFKKRFNFVDSKILLKKILYAHLIVFLLWIFTIFTGIFTSIFFADKFNFHDNYKNKSFIIIVNSTKDGGFKINLKKVPKTDEKISLRDLAGFFLLTNGTYWLIFFRRNKEYKDILRFFNVNKSDIESASFISLIGGILYLFSIFLDAVREKFLYADIFWWIFFIGLCGSISNLFYGWIVSLLVNYKISCFNNKLSVYISNDYVNFFKIYKFQKIYFSNKKRVKFCLELKSKSQKFIIFIPMYFLISIIKEIFYIIIIPSDKLKICQLKNSIIIEDKLKKYILNKRT